MNCLRVALLAYASDLLAALPSPGESANITSDGTATANGPLYGGWNIARLIDGSLTTDGLVHADAAPARALWLPLDGYGIASIKLSP